MKLLHEAEGHVCTIELKTGEVYRGKLEHAEDNMNARMSDITYTGRDGRVQQLEFVFIRGSKVRFFILPDMLKNAPFFNRKTVKGLGAGGGKAALARAEGRQKKNTRRRKVWMRLKASVYACVYAHVYDTVCISSIMSCLRA